MSIDFSKVGLKVGIEIHQQLKTRYKLFCSCPADLSTVSPEIQFYRRLRPTQSELGEVDPAAGFEFRRGRGFLYQTDTRSDCLVEVDEEPPHSLNDEAIDICLTVALMMSSKTIDEIHVMRKIVIDGSNTTGFQRTCIIALGGEVPAEGKKIPIQTVCLEEDAARKTGEEESTTNYNLDRLGIPLIEIATAPAIHTPEEAERVALTAGRILRTTRRVRRGLGTIRQDLNVSVEGGALVEIKGVQKLDLVAKVVEYEVQRQLALIGIKKELEKRGLRREDLEDRFVNITPVFEKTRSQVIQKALERGGVVLAVRLPKFAGLLGRELEPNIRLGTEMSDRARFWGGVGGIFHSDELPGYGITSPEAQAANSALGAEKLDALVLVADTPQNAEDALRAVVLRAAEALEGVPSETRSAHPEGTTHYTRPRPGAARMYPETDVPPVPISRERLERLRSALPVDPERIVERVMKGYGLNRKLASQLLDAGLDELFERIIHETKVSPSVVAVSLTETMKSLERDGVAVENISEAQILETFQLVSSGLAAKENIPDIFTWLSKHGDSSAAQALDGLGIRMLPVEDLERAVDAVVGKSRDMILQRKMNAVGPLLGTLMRDLRGRASADVVSRILRDRIQKELGDQATP